MRTQTGSQLLQFLITSSLILILIVMILTSWQWLTKTVADLQAISDESLAILFIHQQLMTDVSNADYLGCYNMMPEKQLKNAGLLKPAFNLTEPIQLASVPVLQDLFGIKTNNIGLLVFSFKPLGDLVKADTEGYYFKLNPANLPEKNQVVLVSDCLSAELNQIAEIRKMQNYYRVRFANSVTMKGKNFLELLAPQLVIYYFSPEQNNPKKLIMLHRKEWYLQRNLADELLAIKLPFNFELLTQQGMTSALQVNYSLMFFHMNYHLPAIYWMNNHAILQ